MLGQALLYLTQMGLHVIASPGREWHAAGLSSGLDTRNQETHWVCLHSKQGPEAESLRARAHGLGLVLQHLNLH